MDNLAAIKAIAFDLDGTLVDSAPGLNSALGQAMQVQGYPVPSKEQTKMWIGNGAQMLIERALHWAGAAATPDQCQAVQVTFNKAYAATNNTDLLYPQVKQTLDILVGQGYPLALVTNKPTLFVRPMLTALAIENHFCLVLGGDDVVKKKPHPAPLYLVLAQMGLLPYELLLVGDSRNDIQAAQAVGCPSIGMAYGYNYGESIEKSKPDYVLEQFADLLPLLGLNSLDYQEA